MENALKFFYLTSAWEREKIEPFFFFFLLPFFDELSITTSEREVSSNDQCLDAESARELESVSILFFLQWPNAVTKKQKFHNAFFPILNEWFWSPEAPQKKNKKILTHSRPTSAINRWSGTTFLGVFIEKWRALSILMFPFLRTQYSKKYSRVIDGGKQ